MLSTFVLFYLIGVMQDFLLTLNWRFVAHGKVAAAAFFSFFNTIMSVLILYSIISQLHDAQSVPLIIFYAGGIATGTTLAMKAEEKVHKKKKKAKR